MSCQKAEELIHGYLDGELDLARTVEFEQHMHNCETCALAYRTQTILRSSLKGEPLYYGAPEKLKQRIQSSLRSEAKSEVSPRGFGWRWLTVAASLALMLFIGVVVWRVMSRSVRPSGDEKKKLVRTTEGYGGLYWSPDSRFAAYWSSMSIAKSRSVRR